jgi:hypothetical protein
MISFTEHFGGGAALRRRTIWRGDDRLVPGIVTDQCRAFKLRAPTSPATTMRAVAHNGSVYVLVPSVGQTIYTSTDLVTLTARPLSINGFKSLSPDGAFSIGEGLLVCGAGVLSSDAATRFAVYSMDNGATWAWISTPGTASFMHSSGGRVHATGTPAASFWVSASASGPWVQRNFPENAGVGTAWNTVVFNGATWLALALGNDGVNGSACATSVDGETFSSATPAWLAASRLMPVPASRAFVRGGKFIALGWKRGSNFIALMDGADGVTWHQRGSYTLNSPPSRVLHDVSRRAIEIGGVLYAGALLAWGDKYITTLLSTADGENWRLHGDGEVLSQAPASIELQQRAGTSSIVMCGGLLETDVDNGMELYYEL